MNNLNLSEFGESATDDYLSKKRSAEAEKEIVVLSNKATRLLIRHRNHGVHICLGAGIAYNLFIINIYNKTKNMTNISTTHHIHVNN
jgi:hypothetical protein